MNKRKIKFYKERRRFDSFAKLSRIKKAVVLQKSAEEIISRKLETKAELNILQ